MWIGHWHFLVTIMHKLRNKSLIRNSNTQRDVTMLFETSLVFAMHKIASVDNMVDLLSKPMTQM